MRHTGTFLTPTRTEYTFLGWFSEEGVPIVSGSIVETPRDNTLHAEWTEITSDKVEIVFVPKDMSKKDAEDFVKRYTSIKFHVIKVEVHELEGLGTAIKFEEVRDAVDFTNAVRASSSVKGCLREGWICPQRVVLFDTPSSLPVVVHALCF